MKVFYLTNTTVVTYMISLPKRCCFKRCYKLCLTVNHCKFISLCLILLRHINWLTLNVVVIIRGHWHRPGLGLLVRDRWGFYL